MDTIIAAEKARGISTLQPMAEDEVMEIEKILGYEFAEKMLLEEALTHVSFSNLAKMPCKSYKRLAFLGDSLLGILVARELPNVDENMSIGLLAALRDANVDTERLARIAVKNDLHRFIRHKDPQLDLQIEEFKKELTQYPLYSRGLIFPPKCLADIIQSISGAIFMDSNESHETIWKTFKKLAEPLINLETLKRNPTHKLYELCLKYKLNVSFDDSTWKTSMKVEAFVDGNLYGSGTCNYKKIAKNRAAKLAAERLKHEKA